MKTIFYVFLLFVCHAFGEVHATKKPDYFKYHSRINDIEVQFIDGDIKGSLQQYQDLFDEYIPFAKDCFIALQLACWQNDTSRAPYFFDKAFRSGVSWDVLQESSHILTFLGKNSKLHHAIYEKYKETRRQYLRDLNFPLRAHYLSLALKDYSYHDVRQYWGRPEISDSLYAAITLENVHSLVALSKKYGLKFERSTGIRDYSLDPGAYKELDIQLFPVNVTLFLHNACAYFYLKEDLLKAVKEGELHPRIYALIYEFAFQDMLGKKYASNRNDFARFYRSKCEIGNQMKFYNMFPEHFFHHKDLQRVNNDRAELCIASLEHDKMKYDYGVKNKLILFFGLFNTSYKSGI